MKHAECMCTIHKAHATPWTKSLGQATHSMHYLDARIISRCIQDNDNDTLNYYLLRSNVYKERFDTMMTTTACIHELTYTKGQLNDVLKDATSNGSFYEVEVATARVEKNYPHLTEYNPVCAIKRERKIELEIKARKNRWNTQGSYRKLGRQLRGHVKPKTAKKSSLTRVMAPDSGPEGLSKHSIGNDDPYDHLIERNIEILNSSSPGRARA
jgi:hypothetical protein